VEENRAFAEKFGFPYQLLCDTQRAIGMAYGACDEPSAEYAKRISYLIGADGRVERAWAKVDPKAHTEEVLKAL
jgi:peroxiredoxin Q/BCP